MDPLAQIVFVCSYGAEETRNTFSAWGWGPRGRLCPGGSGQVVIEEPCCNAGSLEDFASGSILQYLGLCVARRKAVDT